MERLKSTNSRKKLQVLCHLALIVALIFIAACSKRYDDLPAFWPVPFEDYDNQSVGRFKTSFLVDQIDTYYRGTNPGPIGVTTFVNIDDLYNTSTFGRMLAEQVMSELSMKGYDVVELRHADALQFLASDGEFALSRDIGFVRRERELGGVVVGTYTVSPVRIYLNARLIDPATSMVLSAGSAEMSKSEEIAKMLKGGSLPSSLERIPVKHLEYATFPATLNPNPNRFYEVEESGPAGASPQSPVILPPGKAPTAHGQLKPWGLP